MNIKNMKGKNLFVRQIILRFSDFTLRISSITITKHEYPCLMSNHCQPPKYSCNRYRCGNDEGYYDRNDTDYDGDDDDDDVDEIVEGLQVQSV